MDKEIIRDFGDWKVPESWDDIDLKTYQEYERFFEDKEAERDIRQIIHILTNKSIDEINDLPVEFLDIILHKLSFTIDTVPTPTETTNKIVIDGEEYFINIMEKLKLGEYVAADTAMNADKHDYASIFAILCRKEGEIYDSKFEAEMFAKRKEMFERQPITKIMNLVGFFLNCFMVLNKHSQLFSLVEEELNLTQQNIRTSTKIGAFKRCYLNWRVKKLQKLLKQIKST